MAHIAPKPVAVTFTYVITFLLFICFPEHVWDSILHHIEITQYMETPRIIHLSLVVVLHHNDKPVSTLEPPLGGQLEIKHKIPNAAA